MGPLNYLGQRTAVYDGLHKKREGGSACTDKKAPSKKQEALEDLLILCHGKPLTNFPLKMLFKSSHIAQ